MSISGVSSSYSIQSLFLSDESKRTAVAGQTLARAASGDSVTISDEARAMFFSLKNSSSSSTGGGGGTGDVDVEALVEKWYETYQTSMFGVPPNYSAWCPENVEKLHEVWADSDAVDGGKIVHPEDRSQEANDHLSANYDKVCVLNALGEDVVVTDEVMEQALKALERAKAEWDAKENTRPILDGNGTIVSLDGDNDPDKVENNIKKWQDDELLKLHDDESPDEQDTSSDSTRKADRDDA